MTVQLYFDASITKNPGGEAGYGFVIRHKGKTLGTESGPLPRAGTINQAEYMALIEGLKAARSLAEAMGEKRVEVLGDSQLVIEQVAGRWKTKDDQLLKLRDEAREIASSFDTMTCIWIPRHQNSLADRLANEGVGQFAIDIQRFV